MITGIASGTSTRHSSWRAANPIPSRGFLHVGIDRVEPGERVPEQDQQAVAISGIATVVSERPVIGSSRR